MEWLCSFSGDIWSTSSYKSSSCSKCHPCFSSATSLWLENSAHTKSQWKIHWNTSNQIFVVFENQNDAVVKLYELRSPTVNKLVNNTKIQFNMIRQHLQHFPWFWNVSIVDKSMYRTLKEPWFYSCGVNHQIADVNGLRPCDRWRHR